MHSVKKTVKISMCQYCWIKVEQPFKLNGKDFNYNEIDHDHDHLRINNSFKMMKEIKMFK